MPVAWVMSHVCARVALEQSWKKWMLSQLSNYEYKRKGVSQIQRAVVQHENDRRVKRGKGQLLHFT